MNMLQDIITVNLTVDQDVTSAVNVTKNYKSGKEVLAMVVVEDKLY